MTSLAFATLVSVVGLIAYTYVGYPLLLLSRSAVGRSRPVQKGPLEPWPLISVTVAMYNEEDQAADLIESLLALDYPSERRHILIVSDGSTDRTEEIVAGYADRGVELLSLPMRGGKTAAENAASSRIRGEIVVNTDASIRILPDALKPLIAVFADPEVGLASGRDVSVSRLDRPDNVGESGYVGYEMWIRDLETAAGGIIGASGCFYAIRRDLHEIPVPPSLSRDFSAALKCRESGYRGVSVREAVCLVPRTSSLKKEYRRKVRTITRGLDTLIDRRALLDPTRHGAFAWMLFSHKVCRWAVPWAMSLGGLAVALLALDRMWAVVLFVVGALGVLLGGLGWALGDGRRLPGLLQVPAYGLVGNVAAMHALLRALGGRGDAVWEPTRRGMAPTSEESD